MLRDICSLVSEQHNVPEPQLPEASTWGKLGRIKFRYDAERVHSSCKFNVLMFLRAFGLQGYDRVQRGWSGFTPVSLASAESVVVDNFE